MKLGFKISLLLSGVWCCQVWSIDSTSDGRTLNELGDCNREDLGIEMDLLVPPARVIRSLEPIVV